MATKSLTAVDQALTTGGGGVNGYQLSGTFVGTVTFEGTIDGTNWATVAAEPIAGGASVTSATAPGQWRVRAAGLAATRARCSAYTSGTVVVNDVRDADGVL